MTSPHAYFMLTFVSSILFLSQPNAGDRVRDLLCYAEGVAPVWFSCEMFYVCDRVEVSPMLARCRDFRQTYDLGSRRCMDVRDVDYAKPYRDFPCLPVGTANEKYWFEILKRIEPDPYMLMRDHRYGRGLNSGYAVPPDFRPEIRQHGWSPYFVPQPGDDVPSPPFRPQPREDGASPPFRPQPREDGASPPFRPQPRDVLADFEPQPRDVPTDFEPQPRDVPPDFELQPRDVPPDYEPQPRDVPADFEPQPRDVPADFEPQPRDVPSDFEPQPRDIPSASLQSEQMATGLPEN